LIIYDFIITDNINTYDNIDDDTEQNGNVDDPINEINSNVDCDVLSECVSENSIKIGRTNKEKASIKRVAGDPYIIWVQKLRMVNAHSLVQSLEDF